MAGIKNKDICASKGSAAVEMAFGTCLNNNKAQNKTAIPSKAGGIFISN